MKTTRLWIILVLLVAMSLACGLPTIGAKPTPTEAETISATTEAPDEEPTADNAAEPTEDKGSDSGKEYDTEFPLPDDVSNFTALADGMINFQTKMSIKDALDFYKEALTNEGYTERPLLTVTSDTTFSTVFDGHKSGKAIVVQAVDLGGGNLNISIRLEAIN
jgi:hypothetical protein